MRWFAMLTTGICIVAYCQAGFASATEVMTSGAFGSLTVRATPEALADAASWWVVAQQDMAPEMEQVTTWDPAAYRYDAEDRRDPFVSLVKEKLGTEEGLVPIDLGDRPRGPLERFDISTLKLAGIIWGQLGRRGLIRAPDNKGYFVTVGTYMGEKGGQVINVTDDHLIVEEKYKDPEGNIVGKTLTLPLRRKETQEP
jgi:type IV pilus assembly protein PilP